MKKIIKQLVKLFPNKHVTVGKEYAKYSLNNIITLEYKVYIADGFWIDNNDYEGAESRSHSPIFNNIKDLDKWLSNKIKGYKQVYK